MTDNVINELSLQKIDSMGYIPLQKSKLALVYDFNNR